MPAYTFACDACNIGWIVSCDRSEYTSDQECPKCNGKNTYRDFAEDEVHAQVYNVTTVGQLAERNSKKIGKTKVQEKDAINKEKFKEHMGKAKPTESWWNKQGTANRSEINKMTPQQQKNYIMKGKK